MGALLQQMGSPILMKFPQANAVALVVLALLHHIGEFQPLWFPWGKVDIRSLALW